MGSKDYSVIIQKLCDKKSFENDVDGESSFSDTNELTPVKKQPDLVPKRYTSQNWLSDYTIEFLLG